MNNKELIFLVPSLEQPRVIKRILQSGKTYSKIQVLAFTRNIYTVNNFYKLNNIDNISYEILGSFNDSDLISRFMLYIKLILKVYKKYGLRKKNIYTFGFDLRFASLFIINKYIIYEISDLMWLYKRQILKKLLKGLDSYMTMRSNHVVFTSESFYNKYFSFLKKNKVEIKENKFKSYNLVNPITKIKVDKIRIAYIGAFRYKNIIKYLIRSCSNYKNKVVLNFYGDGESEIIKEITLASNLFDNIYYHGAFSNPESLEKIYGENNLNFVAYDNKKENEKVALPNKFYESGYFNIPIVCSSNTYVGEKVLELKIGWVIDPTFRGIDCSIKELTIKDIIDIHIRQTNLNKEIFEET
jgi:succinoglycan biosynthesis protein ExoL